LSFCPSLGGCGEDPESFVIAFRFLNNDLIHPIAPLKKRRQRKTPTDFIADAPCLDG
jgi:hypothetical protein